MIPPKSTKTKSAKSVTTPGTPHAAKVAKVGKATIAKHKPVPRAASSRRTAQLTHPATPETPSRQVSESQMGGKLSDDHATLRQNIEKMVREVLAARNDTGLPMAFPDQDLAAGLTGIVPPFTQHVLSHWPWVTEDIVKNIALGKFEIDTLPKLHRSDELRTAYLK
jgi:hypothetical protein